MQTELPKYNKLRGENEWEEGRRKEEPEPVAEKEEMGVENNLPIKKTQAVET